MLQKKLQRICKSSNIVDPSQIKPKPQIQFLLKQFLTIYISYRFSVLQYINFSYSYPIFINLVFSFNYLNFYVNQIEMHSRDNSQDLFDKYLNEGSVDYDHIQDHHDQQNSYHKTQLHREEIQQRVNGINLKLEGIINDRLGDLLNSDIKEVDKTLRVIQGLVGEAKRFQDAKAKLNTEIRQLQNQSYNNINLIEKLTKQKTNLENDRNNMNQTLKQNQKKHKEAIDKIVHEKQELVKQIRQIQLRQKTIEAQFRKKQNLIKQNQEQIKKFQQDKPTYKNNFDVLQKFQNGNGVFNFRTNAENQYGQLASESIEFSHRKLATENQHLKECLTNIYRELNSVLELKKEMLKNRRGYDEYQQLFDINTMRPDTLALPENLSKERLKELNENIHKFKEAMKLGDLVDNTLEDRKETCVGGIKNIIKNYKQIVESQDQILNKVILKSKQFKAAEIAQLENRYARMNEANELDKAKKFVEEQSQYLQAKNMELQKTRRMMQNAMKKAEQNKREMLRQRQAFESEALEIRRSIQVLPTMIEEELAKGFH